MAKTAFLDFSSDVVAPFTVAKSRSVRGGVTMSRFRVRENHGARLATAQLALFMHEGEPIELSYRLAESDRQETLKICPGQFHLLPAGRPAEVRWTGEKQSLVVAFDENFIERTLGEAFDGKAPDLYSRAALSDQAVDALMACLRREMARNCFCNRLYVEYVGASLLIRLFEAYGDGGKPPPQIKGGLGGRRQKRVVEFIEAHLTENLSLAAIAAEAGLSSHHFGKAFKGTFGVAPCRYVAKRRINRAKELLLSDHRSITEIAYALGFCSHSHLCDSFRQATGMTPSEFRKMRD